MSGGGGETDSVLCAKARTLPLLHLTTRHQCPTMDILTCPRCQRANPSDAAFCHFDGVELRPGQGRNGRQTQLPQEFVFPYGRRCRTFDELAQGCQAEWEVARELLKQGVFQRFLT